MKKIFSLVAASLLFVGAAFARTNKSVVIKAGTIVPVQSVNSLKAADAAEGQTVDFRVVQDIVIDGVNVIPSGSLVKGKVTLAKKSSLAGTKGRLEISINSMYLPSGQPVFFTNSDIHISGHNRTPLAVVTGLLIWPCIFIPGTKAVMPAGYEAQLTVVSNVEVNVE